jgi:putative membrane protein insertion efficiency factor
MHRKMSQPPAGLRRGVQVLRAGSIAVLRGLVYGYQLTLSPYLGPACRFHPTCSHYALQALADHGPLYGLWLTLRRLLRCHPWHPGGIDEVPPTES